MTIRDALNLSTDSQVLLAHILKRDRAWLFANPEFKLSPLPATSYQLLIAKRARHWPTAYLTGHKEFFRLNFKITPDVLIPRPETELLVELALEVLKAKNYNLKAIIDIGTGSGCIITALVVILTPSLSRGKHLKFFAIDNSLPALKIAQLNARRHAVAKKIKFFRGNLLAPTSSPPILRRGAGGEREGVLILGNLPYLTPRQYASNPDLAREPRSALVGGNDGLKYYRELFAQLKNLRHSERTREESQRSFVGIPPQDDRRIILLLEHDPRQKTKLAKLAKKHFPNSKITFHRDLSGRPRAVEIAID